MKEPLHIPTLGDQVPQRGNGFSKWLGRLLMRAFRWHVEGEICRSSKVLFVMAPHSSWWDFTNNFGVMLALGIDVHWFIAKKYTRGIVGRILGYFGAVQVDRSHHTNMVSHMVSEYQHRDKFALAIFPEGTRKPVPKWKTGFWYIAKQADVPVQLVAFDYQKRAAIFGPVFHLSDDIDQDIKQMRDYFRPVVPKHPERVNWSN
jgi:1-acyl-sn-glycerol-3-phosphate acyltransferase